MYRLLDMDASSIDDTMRYPETSSTAIAVDNIAEEISQWRRISHPDRIAFILDKEAEVYLTLAQQLYENRHSSAKVLQLFTDFIQKYLG